MAQSDVTVKLSAEGLSQVVAAFQKIASEGKKSGHEASESFKELNNQLKDVAKTLTGGIGIILVAEKFKEFFKSTLEGSEILARLSKQTGLSTDLIQGFGRAARETGVDQESANAAIAKFTVQVGKAGVGSKASRDALSDLGISIKDFSKLAPDQQFAKVAEKLAGIADPARRARDEVALFGKAGTQLDQALVSVGKDGIEPFIEHLKELGVFLDKDSIASIKHAAETFKDLGDTVKGVATQFLVGLVPGLQAATDELLKATTGSGVSGFKALGELIGEVFATAVNYIEHAANDIASLALKTQIFFTSLAAQAKNIFNPAEVKRLANAAAAEIKAVQEATEERNKAADYRLNDKSTAASIGFSGEPGGKGSDGAEGGNAAQIAKAKLALTEASLDNELKLYKAHAALVKESDKQSYEEGSISLKDYYSKRAAQINSESDKEVAVLKAKRQALASTSEDINDPVAAITKQKELDKLKTEIQIKEIQRSAELAANVDAQSNAQRKLYEDTLKTELRLLEIAGKKTEAARLKLALDIADLDTELRKAGVSDPDRAAAVGQFAAQGNAANDYTAAATKAKTDLQNLTTAEKELQDKVRSGQLFSIDAAQKIVAEQQKLLPELQADAAAMTAFAEASGKAENIAAAKAYQEQIDRIAASANTLGQAVKDQKQGFENAVGAGINTFLTDAVSGTKTLKTSFADMARSIVADILKMEIQAVEAAALKAIFNSAGALSGGGSVGGVAGGAAGAASTTPGYSAAGGHIRGPGTSTSDSIPAFLSDGEFVINAKSVKQPGVLPLLNALNDGGLKGVHGPTGIPKYASGGQVSGASLTTHKIVNVLDPSLLGDHLATEPGERAVLNIIGRNPNKVRSSL